MNMPANLLRFIGKRAAHKAVAHHAKPGGFLDIKFGFSLLRDGRVPVVTKALAIALGAGITVAVIALEFPIEAILGLFLPFLGFGLDFIADGLEAVLLPFVFAAMLLPHLTPKQLVEYLRTEA